MDTILIESTNGTTLLVIAEISSVVLDLTENKVMVLMKNGTGHSFDESDNAEEVFNIINESILSHYSPKQVGTEIGPHYRWEEGYD